MSARAERRRLWRAVGGDAMTTCRCSAVTCCTKAEQAGFADAWVPCWPWRGRVCRNCGEVTTDFGTVLEFLWTLLVWPWWRGQVLVRGHEDELPAE